MTTCPKAKGKHPSMQEQIPEGDSSSITTITTSTTMAPKNKFCNPSFTEKEFQIHYQRWKASVGEDTLQEEEITEELMRATCKTICTKFPRGTECGQLLWEPIVDDDNVDTPLEQRGISMEWLNQAYCWMKETLNSKGPVIPTRLFVALFVEPLVLQSPPCAQQQQQKQQKQQQRQRGVIPLYYFLPLQFRGRPQVFLSHGWDSWLRHLLYLPATSEPGKLATKNGHHGTFLWLDIFAIVQDPGSTKQQFEVAQIGEVVRSIGKTCLIVPGHGSLHFALLPARRSWCCFEIAHAQDLSARVGFTKARFTKKDQHSQEHTSFHQTLIDEICELKCSSAETCNENEKKAIQDLLEQELGLECADRRVQRAILRAFYERYLQDASAGDIARMYCQAFTTLFQEANEESPRLYPNPPFREEAFHLHFERWKKAVGEETLKQEGIKEGTMLETCRLICTRFPRGTRSGMLLLDPVVDDTPLEHRGVSMHWLKSAWIWMKKVIKSDGGLILSTRLFVAFFVEPFVLQQDQQYKGALPLYYFVPVPFRGRPHVFLSHCWDSWLRHLLNWPERTRTVPAQLAKKNGKQNTFLWLDIFAIVQDPGSTKQQTEVAQIGEVVRSIGQTCLIVPGNGSPHFALLPARRSWCCLEIAYTQNLSARVGFNGALFAASDCKESCQINNFHQSIIDEIRQLKCSKADTGNKDEKEAILDLLDQELGLEYADRMVQIAILQSFGERYGARKGIQHRMYREALKGIYKNT